MKSLTTTVTGGALTLPNFYQGTFTPTVPVQQVSVGQFPAANPNWARILQLSDQALYVKSGSYAVAISITDLINLALVVEPNLTWTPPVILTQPTSASCVHGSTAATFTVVAGSEYTMSYQWKYSTDSGSTWNNCTGTVSGCVFTNGTTASLTCTPSTTGLNGALIKCTVTDNAGSFGLTNGSIDTSSVTLTIT